MSRKTALRTLICRGLVAILSVAAGGTPAAAQGPFYSVRADAAQADSHVSANANPLVEGTEKPFWSAVEPLINRYDLCTDLTGSVANPAKVLNYTDEYAQMAVAGSNSTLAWMEKEGLYPFENISLEVADPRAPSGFPIFCTMNPINVLDQNGRLRALFFHFEFDEPVQTAYLFAKADIMFPGLEPPADYNLAARIQNGASWNLANLWDVNRRWAAAEDEFAPPWLTVAAIDALSVVSLEDTGVFTYENYDDIELRLPFLQGNFSRRLTDFKRGSRPDAPATTPSVTALTPNAAPLTQPMPDYREDETKGALIKFLIEDHLDGEWGQLKEILNVATNADDHMIAIDEYIDTQDGDLLRGLEHGFPAFVAHQASLPFADYQGHVEPDVWLEDSFGGCEDVIIDEVTLTKTTQLEVLPYAARCIVLRMEARHAPWHGDLQIQMSVAGGQAGDDRIDDVFMSASAHGYEDLTEAFYSCSEAIDDTGAIQECIFVPNAQGRPRTDEGVLQRLYHVPVGKKAVGERRWSTVLLSYVPKDARPGGAESRPGVNVEIKWSLDTVIDGGGGELADMGGSGDEFELMDMSTAVIDHGSKVGLAPILTRQAENKEMSWQNIWDGMASPISVDMLENAMAQFDNLIHFKDEVGDGFGVIITDPNVLKPGFTGPTTDYIPVSGKAGYVSVADPDYQGKIEIIENTKDTLHFTVEDSFCMVPESELPQMIRQNIADFCEYGERVKAKAEGAIAFPELRRSETKLDPVETEAYRGLRKIRLEKIQSRFGASVVQGGFGPQPSTTGPSPVPSSSRQNRSGGINGGPELNVCTIVKQDMSCDCRCDAKKCFDSKSLNSTLAPREAACRLTCGKRWKSCDTAAP